MKPAHYSPTLFKSFSPMLSLILALEDGLSADAIENPVAQKLLQDLIEYRKQGDVEEFIPWIVKRNSALAADIEENLAKTWVKDVHEQLAEMLWKVYADSSIRRDKSNLFVRDLLLKQAHGFNSYPWIVKHALPLTNPLLFKGYYYNDDPSYDCLTNVYDDVTSITDSEGISEESSSENEELETVLLADLAFRETQYKRDTDFQAIVKAHRGLDVGFVGVATTKGGLHALLHIILEQEGDFRFVGGLDPNLGRSDSAYSHGPFFIAIKGSMYERPKLNGVYDLTLSEMQFLLPDEERCTTLKNKLTSFVKMGLLKADLNKVFAQIFTYEQYRKTLPNTEELSLLIPREPTTDVDELSSPVALF